MRKTLRLLGYLMVCLILGGCQQTCTRNFGGSTTIVLPEGEKLLEATWKDDNLWYLTEPMDSNYIPHTKIFHESSVLGLAEGTVTFVEKR